jgi:gamma-glutamylcyclotransferase (GGCT)/AIG2-like uncharacterized protein YtfP
VSQLIFFYGTLMTPFNRPGRRRIDSHLVFKGNGRMTAALFDLGIYPAAVPAGSDNARVRGEVHQMTDASAVLAVLDEVEGYSSAEPDTSLYTGSSHQSLLTMETWWTPGRTSIMRRSAARSGLPRATTSNT